MCLWVLAVHTMKDLLKLAAPDNMNVSFSFHNEPIAQMNTLTAYSVIVERKNRNRFRVALKSTGK